MTSRMYQQSEIPKPYRIRMLEKLAESGYDVIGDEVIIPSFADVETIIAAALASGEDPHEATAKEMYGGDEVTPDQRRVGKIFNFPILYGYRGKR